jgi:transcriptional regulator with XRE-family HTH domain/DNA-directed RNA polymerase subunit RPC12/RpoP
MDLNKTGKFIAACRREKELTQAALAEKLGITDRAVSKWENGKCLPDASIMPELCNILGISINELFVGEKIAVEDYRKIAEKNLAEIADIEKNKNIKLVRAELFVLWSGVAVSLFMIVCGFLIAGKSASISIALLSFGGIVMLVSAFYSVILEHDSGYYECENCRHRYIPSVKAVIFATHVGSDRLLRCPKCSKKVWHKKVLTK